MQVRIRLFATLKDLAGQNNFMLDIPGDETTVGKIRTTLASKFPEMQANVAAAIASVNQEYAFDQEAVSDGDEVAFFPPVSGGSDQPPEIFRLPHAPISHDELVEAITTPATGAVCFFSGLVRGTTDKVGHLPQTEHLEYEAYEPMALAKMRQVAGEIRSRWPKVQGIAIVQRLGKLKVGQNTVLIACSSAHRDDGCFEAARYGIDRLKEIVPVWKKEVSPAGEAWVEGGYTPSPDDRTGGAS
jgi:MoaE-MoaD fusion protein